jgi:sugar-specific transcriptional regulator TrmB
MADLRDLGLSSYEDRAYRSLLGLGPVAATELSEASGVPKGRIYDVLDSLEAHGMVRAQATGRPKQYVAVEPEVAIDRVVETRTQELAAEIDRTEAVGNRLIDDLSSESTVEERFWTTAIGTENAIELLFERIDVADEEVVLVADVVTPAFDIAEVGPDVLDQLASALERGVDVSVLVSRTLAEEVPRQLIDRIRQEPFRTDGFEVRTVDELYGSFYLLDHVELCFEVTNPIERNAMVGLVNLKDPSFAIELESQFQQYWEGSEPFTPDR